MYAADPPLSDTRRPSARRRAILTPHAVRPTTDRSKAEDHQRGSPSIMGVGPAWPYATALDGRFAGVACTRTPHPAPAKTLGSEVPTGGWRVDARGNWG